MSQFSMDASSPLAMDHEFSEGDWLDTYVHDLDASPLSLVNDPELSEGDWLEKGYASLSPVMDAEIPEGDWLDSYVRDLDASSSSSLVNDPELPEGDWLENYDHDRDAPSSSLAMDPEMQLPEGDWFENYYRKLSSNATSLICHWSLDWGTFVSVNLNNNDVRIHIRDFKQRPNQQYYATQQGVMLHPTTWTEFSHKLNEFNTTHKDSSFIANNQLAVFRSEDCCVLQQLFQNGDTFTLKPTFIKLYDDQIYKLLDILPVIDQCLRETLLCVSLPHFILDFKDQRETCLKKHIVSSDARATLVSALCYELLKHMDTLIHCKRCVGIKASQHECTKTDFEKFQSVGKRALGMLNVRDIAYSVCEHFCTCCYSMDFFVTLSYEHYIHIIENLFHQESKPH